MLWGAIQSSHTHTPVGGGQFWLRPENMDKCEWLFSIPEAFGTRKCCSTTHTRSDHPGGGVIERALPPACLSHPPGGASSLLKEAGSRPPTSPKSPSSPKATVGLPMQVLPSPRRVTRVSWRTGGPVLDPTPSRLRCPAWLLPHLPLPLLPVPTGGGVPRRPAAPLLNWIPRLVGVGGFCVGWGG